ncbi:START domain-containing protein 10 isoform X1 [Puntigrus tetrazona]|uniref:START domain-containing protein 10 n=2 Tax=Cyprinidae TaxID=7953 RepID=UPI001C89C76A|nr:START domain-containing protein 10 isoform X1 [Puntigrus tetrazona]XP_050984180.1 START domain-containing protein 10 [Labeo rohita]
MPVQIPDDTDFLSFRDQCESQDGWVARYNKGGVTVWCRDEECKTVQKLKMRIVCKDVTAETLYDVLHDTSYRKKWDTNMIDTFDIGRLTVNADVGYYSWKCPSPLKNRDFVTMRSWLPLGNDYLIINYSVKHPEYPPKKDYVRAVSLLTGYLIQSSGANCCTLYYLTQVDPRGSLPKWVVNRASQLVAPKAMKKIYKACLKYPEWKRKHEPNLKPWRYPEQNTLPCINVADLTVQRADSLENIDESSVSEEKAQHHSDDDET